MKVTRIFLLLAILLLALLAVAPVLAVTWEHRTSITVQDTSETSRIGVTVVSETIKGDNLVSAGFVNSNATDTMLQESSSDRKFLICDNKTLFFIPSLSAGQQRSFYLYTGYSPVVSSFPFIAGEGGYVTVADNDTLELGNNFSIEFDGWVDTSLTSSYPVVEGSNSSTTETAGTSHNASLPSGIEAGDLLLLFIGIADDYTFTWPSGWIELDQEIHGWASGEAAGVAYKIATGTEGSSVTVTTSASCRSAHQTYRISNYFDIPSISPSAEGDGSHPDPSSLSVCWESTSPTLWFAVSGGNDGGLAISSYPPSYSDGTIKQAAGDGSYITNARRELTTSSENPGQFTFSATALGWVAWTVGIRGMPAPLVDKCGAITLYTSGTNFTAQILGGTPKTLTVSGLSSSEYKVEVYANTTNFTIEIDDVVENTTALGGASVPANSNNWTISIPYFNYYKHTVNSTLVAWYQPVAMIEGTTLPDREGTAQNGVITWGTSSSSLTTAVGETVTYTETVAESETTETDPGMIPSLPEPEGWYPAGNTSKFPFYTDNSEFHGIYDMIKDASDNTAIPVATLYLFGMIGIATAIGLGVAIFTGSVLLTAVSAGTFMAACVGTTVIGWWMVFVFIVMAGGILYLARAA